MRKAILAACLLVFALPARAQYNPTMNSVLFSGWQTAARPVLPAEGQCGFNITLAAFECWSGAAWTPPSASLVTAANGLNAQTLANWFGEQSVNLLGQNVKGDGATNDQAALLAATALAQSTGNALFIPTPPASYNLNSDVSIASGDLFAQVSPGYTSSGIGLLKFDTQLPFQHPYVFSFDLLSKTYGSAWNGYSNIMQVASVAINNGTTAAPVAIYGEGITYVPFSSNNDAWGGNLVCAAMVSASACFGLEIDVIAGATGTQSKGLSLNAVNSGGSFQPNQAIYVSANSSTSAWQSGLVFSGGSGNNPVSGPLISTTGTNIVIPTYFLQMTGASASSDELDFPSFQIGPTSGSAVSRIGVLPGTTATGSPSFAAKIQVLANPGGGTSAADMDLKALNTGGVWISDGKGVLGYFNGISSTIANYFSTTPAATGTPVALGCTGSDSNITCNLSTAGTGSIVMLNGDGTIAQFLAPSATTISYPAFTAEPSGTPVTISVGGTADALLITAAGQPLNLTGSTIALTGAVSINSTAAVSCSGALTGSAVVTNGIVTHC